MTTIAYTNRILAADTQLSWEAERHLTTKIKRLTPNLIIACAGSIEQEHKAHSVFRDPNWEELDLTEKLEDFAAIVLINKKPYFLSENLIPIAIEEPHFAIGSGGAFALSAMYFGYNAADAVRFASRFDIYTNDKVETYENAV